jgi:lysophospholipase L1-like esterase
MKTILCYGDSNTWGCSDAGPFRYDYANRWPGILQEELAGRYRVIEEGLPGRTTVLDDPYEDWKNGLTYLRPCLDSHNPDIVLILLGTNDLKRRFDISAWDIAQGAAKLVHAVLTTPVPQGCTSPKVCLLAPPPVLEIGPYAAMFQGAAQKSRDLPRLYRQIAQDAGVHFFDTSAIIEPSPSEGLHWRSEEHRKLACALAKFIRETFSAS